jgi:hypothetical protein
MSSVWGVLRVDNHEKVWKKDRQDEREKTTSADYVRRAHRHDCCLAICLRFF